MNKVANPESTLLFEDSLFGCFGASAHTSVSSSKTLATSSAGFQIKAKFKSKSKGKKDKTASAGGGGRGGGGGGSKKNKGTEGLNRASVDALERARIVATVKPAMMSNIMGSQSALKDSTMKKCVQHLGNQPSDT